MPQLWTETFVSQYFWFALILLTFYYFIVTKIIPNVANAIKARQVNENTELKIEENTNIKTSELLNENSKQDITIPLLTYNEATIDNEWLLTKPEENNIYWTETTLSETAIKELDIPEDEELKDSDLEEYITWAENNEEDNSDESTNIDESEKKPVN